MSDGVYRRHQRRAIALTRAVQGSERVETELAIPESSRAIDMLISAAEASDAWGVLRDNVAARNVLIEHFSTPPSAENVATALLKGAWAVEQWLAARQGGSEGGRWHLARPPLTLVLSVGRPRKALEFFGMLRAEMPQGIYRTTGAGLEVVLVDVRNLERTAGTAFLSMLNHRGEVVERNLRRLQNDPGVGILTKEAIGAAIMSEPTVFDPQEHRVTYQEAQLQESRRFLLRLLAERIGSLPRDLEQAIESCSSRETLDRLGSLVLQEADPEALQAKARELLAGEGT